MGATEIILIVIGVVVFLLGYLMPAKKKDMDEEVQLISEDEVRKLVAGEVEHVKDRIADIVEETVSYSIEKTERAMERLTNEKIMAINEYSDTVLEEINKNHQEVVFLYDMLNDKHDNLMSTINEASAASDEIKQALKDTEATAKEAAGKVEDVLRSVDEASGRITDVLRTADDAVKGVWDAQNAARVAREAAQEALRIATEVSESRKADVSLAGQADRQKELTGVQRIQKMLREEAPDQNNQVEEINVPADAVEGQSNVPEAVEGWITAADFDADTAEIDDMTEQKEEEEFGFKPIVPKRVEVIHEPDEDELTDRSWETSIGAAFTENMEKGVEENTPVVDIQFANSPDNGRNSNDRILELHKAGKSNMAIAKELGLGLGEVKLVIDLFEGV